MLFQPYINKHALCLHTVFFPSSAQYYRQDVHGLSKPRTFTITMWAYTLMTDHVLRTVAPNTHTLQLGWQVRNMHIDYCCMLHRKTKQQTNKQIYGFMEFSKMRIVGRIHQSIMRAVVFKDSLYSYFLMSQHQLSWWSSKWTSVRPFGTISQLKLPFISLNCSQILVIWAFNELSK